MLKSQNCLVVDLFKIGILVLLSLIFSLSWVYANKANNDNPIEFQQKIRQINSFLSFVHQEKSINEKLLSYERSRLVNYRNYLDTQMTRVETDLNRINTVLHFIEKRYQNEKFSDFVNRRVEKNKTLNTKLKEYIQLRSLALNNLVLLEETRLDVESALNDVSNKRTYVRNKFKFEKNNILWDTQQWKYLFKDISFNALTIIKELVYFISTLIIYFLCISIFSKKKFLSRYDLSRKSIIKEAIFKWKGLLQLTFSIILYPLAILFILYVALYFGFIKEGFIYTISLALQIIVIYSFSIFSLEQLAKVKLSKCIKLSFCSVLCLLGLAMYLFRSDLFHFSNKPKALIMPINDSIIFCFITMVIMVIPAVFIFVSLGKELRSQRTLNRNIVQAVRYFIFNNY